MAHRAAALYSGQKHIREESSWEMGFPTSPEKKHWGAADCPNILWAHSGPPALRFDLFVSVTRWEQKCHIHGVAEGSTDLEKPGRKPTKGTESAVHFKCPISLLNCLLFFHWALKGAKLSLFANSQTVIKSRKLKLFIKQVLGSLSHLALLSVPQELVLNTVLLCRACRSGVSPESSICGFQVLCDFQMQSQSPFWYSCVAKGCVVLIPGRSFSPQSYIPWDEHIN